MYWVLLFVDYMHPGPVLSLPYIKGYKLTVHFGTFIILPCFSEWVLWPISGSWNQFCGSEIALKIWNRKVNDKENITG